MAKHLLIKTVIASICIMFLTVFGCFQTASAESLSGYTANGTASTTSASFAFGTVAKVYVSTAVTVNDPVLVVVSFSTESTGTLTIQKDPEFNLTNTAGTADNTIYRSLQGVNGGDADNGIGSIVNIYTAATTNPTYYFQHRVSTAGSNIQTKATIVAIPLHSSPNNKILASASARAAAAVAAPATPTEVTNTNISVGTTAIGYSASPGAYYLSASVETYSTSISGTGNIGEWQFQYSADSGGSWNNLGYPVQRNVRTANQYGIANLVALLPNITPTADYRFRLVHHKISGATDIFTANVNIVAVFTGIWDGTNHLRFPTYETQSDTETTTSVTPVEAIGFDFVPQVASTSLFMHAQYWMNATGKVTAQYDLDLLPDPPFISQQLDRYMPAGSTGSGASVGLASNLDGATPTTYRVSLRHSKDISGQTLTTRNPWLVMMDLNTNPVATDIDLSVTKTCEDLIPGQDRALIYTINIENLGTVASPVSTLNDTIPAGVPVGADLTNIKYVIDAGIPPATGATWPVTNIISLPSIGPGSSIAVRIYADVPYTLTSIPANTAIVTLAADTDNSNNSDTCSTVLTTAPTSSRAMSFDSNDGTDDYVSVADAGALDLNTSGTLEAWIYLEDFATGAGIIHKGNGSTDEAYSLRFGFGTQNDQIQLVVNDGTADTLTSGTALNLRQWYHVAGTWDGIDMAIYIDGIPDKTKASSTAARNSGENLFIGAQDTIGSNSFDGIIDEARVWNTERGIPVINIDEIRDYMCKKYPAGTPDPDLVCYLQFDEDFGPICGDTSGNGNIGIITNAVRICSEAPIGDDSTHDYVGAISFTVTNTKTNGDSFTAEEDGAGTWRIADKSGLQVYRIDGTPEPASGSIGSKLYTSRSYWGVFVTGGVDPTYSATYTYNEGGIKDENELKLMFRHKNCQPWRDIGATLNAGTDTLTYLGLSGTEFILGANVDPRNTIIYDSSANNFTNIPDNASLQLSTSGTLELWIYLPATPTTSAGIINKGNATNGYSLYTDATNGDQVIFSLNNSLGTSSTVTSSTALNPETWYHIAATWNATDTNLYINGVLDPAFNGTIAGISSGTTSGSPLTIGRWNTNYFDGLIDEVRVWNVARNQTQVRNTMCKKITSSETGFATDLIGYWRFDEETDSNACPDYSSKTNTGAMFNFGTTVGIQIRNARICSSAPIGNDSNYAYYDSGAISPVSAQLAHPDGDYMFATENSGTWTGLFSGIQLYLINEVPVYPPDLWDLPTYPVPPYGYVTPNGLTPPTGWSSIDYYRYWGAFVTDPVNEPSYDLVYNYTGNPMVPVDDTNLDLARRPEYCFGTWSGSGASLDAGGDTLTILGDSLTGTPRENPEYVLGGKDAPLAITLASFYAEFDRENDCIRITWKTATEVDTIGFQLWRSDTKEGPYTLISGSFTASQAVSETTGAQYSYSDCDADLDTYMTFYYKLEEIDLDTTKKNPVYGPIGPVTESVGASQLDRDSGSAKSSGGCFIDSLSK